MNWTRIFLAGNLTTEKNSLFWPKKQDDLFFPFTYQFQLERQSSCQERGRSEFLLVDKKILKIFVLGQPAAALINQYQCEMKGTSEVNMQETALS